MNLQLIEYNSIVDVTSWVNAGPVIYWLIFIALLAESTIIIGLFAPGVSALVLGSFIAGTGELSGIWVWIIGFTSVVLGDNMGYALGRVSWRSEKIQSWLQRAGLQPRVEYQISPLTLFYQFPVVTRAPTPIYLGLRKIRWYVFLLVNLLASTMFITVLFLPAYLAGQGAGTLVDVQDFADTTQYIFLSLAAAWLTIITTRIVKQRHAKAN